jgi:hypothetical protein
MESHRIPFQDPTSPEELDALAMLAETSLLTALKASTQKKFSKLGPSTPLHHEGEDRGRGQTRYTQIQGSTQTVQVLSPCQEEEMSTGALHGPQPGQRMDDH